MPKKSDVSQQRAEKKKEFTKFVKSYDYVDKDGTLLFQKVRYVDQDGKKTFRQRRPGNNGEWIYSLGDTPKVLYNLPAVIKAKNEGFYIWVVEGEKDADTLMEAGVIATTMPGGAGKWLDIHTEALRGAHVQIVADNDEPGKKHADSVYRELAAAGCSVGVWQSPIAKDITDHLQSGGTIESLVELDLNIDFDAVADEKEEETPVSEEEQTLSALLKLLDREDLTTKQKLAKSSSIISTTGAAPVLDPGRLVLWDDFLKESEEDKFNQKSSLNSENYFLSVIENMLGDEGVKNLAIKTILPGLNATIAHMVNEMHLSFHIRFDEKFNCIINHLGEDINPKTLSTGERKKADFIVVIALIKLLKLRFPQLNLLFLDEIFSSIDHDGIYSILKILSSVIKENELNTFVINHTVLPQEIFDKKIEIYKDNGFSKFTVESIR
jgi:5S rRNA maturation endonuclease (ribonuclease M5)